MAKELADSSRRGVLKAAILGVITLTTAALTTAVRAQGDNSLKLSLLIDSLRSAGGPVCLGQADALEASQAQLSNFDLHLRRAGLNAQQAQSIAAAIHAVSSQQGSALRSFSMSFNPGVSDAGAKSLARALPLTVTEVGLVGCAIGDEGGEALLSWAEQAPELRLICVEDNRMSQSVRAKFSALGRQNPTLQVVV